MNRPIPGYYYDEEKKKYFKIEKSHTAPTRATWSSDNVKRRKVEDRAARARAQRAELLSRHIKRASVLVEPLAGGFLDRELGVAPQGLADRTAARDAPAAAWAGSLAVRGEFTAFDVPSLSRPGPRHNLESFLVTTRQHGDDWESSSGAMTEGVVFAKREFAVGLDVAQIGIDENERVEGSLAPRSFRRQNSPVQSHTSQSQISAMAYHENSDTLLAVYNDPDSQARMAFYKYLQLPTLGSPIRPSSQGVINLDGAPDPSSRHTSINSLALAPHSGSTLVASLGTNAGVLLYDDEGGDRGSWLPPPRYRGGGCGYTVEQREAMDVLAHSFLPTNSRVLHAGTRSSAVYTMDCRAPPTSWSFFRHASAVTHLRPLRRNENHLLVAGLRSSMAVYDLRFLPREDVTHPFRKQKKSPQSQGVGWEQGRGQDRKRGRSSRDSHNSGSAFFSKRFAAEESFNNSAEYAKYPTAPVVTFPSYRNEAHIHIGFDANEDAGILAGAHDDGTVATYSLLSGRRLPSPGGLDALRTDVPVKCMQFQGTPLERHASLWVGAGESLKKFSVGTESLDSEE